MQDIGAVFLAGGLSRRMEGPEKSLVALDGKTMLGHVLDTLTPQVAQRVLNANGDAARFEAFGLPVVADSLPDNPGPLAGVLAGMDWMAANAPEVCWMVSVPCDTPVLPQDLVARLFEAVEAEGADIAMAGSGGRVHPVAALWKVSLAQDLRTALTDEGVRKVRQWTDRYPTAIVDWSVEPFDPFSNVNTPAELAEARSWVAGNRLPH